MSAICPAPWLLCFFPALFGLASCTPPEPPCSLPQTLENVSWLPPAELAPKLAGMNAAVADAKLTGAPPSMRFATAERDLKVEFWADAAEGLLAVARGESNDDRPTRQTAQFHLAIALYRLKYFTEARSVLHAVVASPDHPALGSAEKWLHKRYCEPDK
jgi:hypothetical protein